VKVFVTGASGFIGRHVVRELLDRGHDVTVLVRPSAAPRPELDGSHLLRGDLRRPTDALARALIASDAIVHAAAVSSGSWRGMFAGTVLATEWLLEKLRSSGWGGRLVHVSSFAVYGLNQVPEGAVVDESTPLEPEPQRRGYYAWTKSLQERIVREFAEQTEAEVVIVRPGAVYGADRSFQHRLGRRVGARVLVVLGGRTVMPLNYVENTASLLAECVEHPRAAGEVFNAVDPDPPTQRDYQRWWRAGERGRISVVTVPLGVLGAIRGAYAILGVVSRGRVSAPGFFDAYDTGPGLRRFKYATDKPTRLLGWRPPVPRAEARRRTFTSGRSSA
jgi:2-alkyl-3-oxoalkanoate reductase